MARRGSLSPLAAARLADPLISNLQQAIVPAATAWSNHNALAVDASPKFIAIPPIAPGGSAADPANVSNHLLLSGSPVIVELYRLDEFYFAINTVVNTMVGAWVPGGVLKTITLDPGLQGDTLAFVSTVNTSPLRINWGQ